ncbi:MAG TPA: N-formylglutamate amidohydrolase, partial [Acidimicrobiia bacterium]|nr:N-formylglutamate amidohydrolase [Acidimicrobiia bacterium]
DLWRGGVLPTETVERSRRLHTEFYHRLRQVLDDLLERHGGFVLYDVHSYNDRPKEGAASGPFVNLGTGSLPRRWSPVADAFLESMRSAEVSGKPLDAEENVVFRGRHVAGFVHDVYGETACALAIEFKKSFLDEWSGEVYPEAMTALAAALAASVDPTWKAHQACR